LPADFAVGEFFQLNVLVVHSTVRISDLFVCSSVRLFVCSPVIGALPSIAANVSMTGPAGSVAAAGPWMCEAVVAPLKPSVVTTQAKVLASVSCVTSTVPVAAQSTGGTCAAPVSSTVNFIISACAAELKTERQPRLP